MPSTPRLSAPRRTPLFRLVRANLYDLLRLLAESRIALTGFTLVMLAGTAYIHATYPLGYAESLYEAFRLLTLQSGLAFPSDPIGKALFLLVPVLGLALILDSVFRFGRLLLDKGSRREAWQVALASTYQRHVIVCGLGRVGFRVVTQLLATGHEVVVVERNWGGEFVQRMLALRVPVVLGDARDLDVLRQAGLARANALVVCIDADLVNVEVALNVRGKRPDLRVILRVFNEDLDRNLEGTFGRNTVFSASALAAPTFAAAAISREVRYVLPLGEESLGVAELVVAQDSLMSGFVNRIEAEHGIRVLAHVDASGRERQSGRMRQLAGGDRVVVIGPLRVLETLRANNMPRSKAHAVLGMLERQRPSPQRNKVIVCGLGKVGFRVINRLHQMQHPPPIVCIYNADTRPEFVHHIGRLEHVTLVEGDARSADVLQAAGLEEAYSVAALTSDDFTNMQICLAARRVRPDIHLVMRLFNDVLVEQLEQLFAIRTVYSTSALAAPTLAAAAALGDVHFAFFSGTALFSVDQCVIQPGDMLEGLSVEQVRERHSAFVLSIRRDGVTITLPPHEHAIASGDDVALVAQLDSLARLRVSRRATIAISEQHAIRNAT